MPTKQQLDKQIEDVSKRLRELRRQRSEFVLPERRTRVVKRQCRHGLMSEFKVTLHEWRCSNCGYEGVWNNNWSYFGALSCRKCGCEPAIEFVVCSDKCRRALVAKEPEVTDAETGL